MTNIKNVYNVHQLNTRCLQLQNGQRENRLKNRAQTVAGSIVSNS